MKIRKDFQSIEEMLYSLLEYAEVFRDNDSNLWPRLKNDEDFFDIYNYEQSISHQLQKIYIVGRDVAHHFSFKLPMFNSAYEYPTIFSYVNSFESDWCGKINDLKQISNAVKNCLIDQQIELHSLKMMVALFDKQVEMIDAINGVLSKIKKSKIYKADIEPSFKLVLNYLKENPMKTLGVVGSICSIIGFLLYFVPSYSVAENMNSNNQSPTINGNNNSVNLNISNKVDNSSTTNNTNNFYNQKTINNNLSITAPTSLDNTKIYLKYTKLLKEPNITAPVFLCDVEEGSLVRLLEELQDDMKIAWVHVKVLLAGLVKKCSIGANNKLHKLLSLNVFLSCYEWIFFKFCLKTLITCFSVYCHCLHR
ncbi:MAG: hypothetical protein AB7E76_13930 [Deferribacterales bacterium]